MAGDFETTNLDWQIQLLRQRVGEWIELQFSRIQGPSLPRESPVPPWVLETLFWVTVAGFLIWAGLQVYRILSPYWAHLLSQRQSQRTASRVATAPPPLTVEEWWQQAQRLRQQGKDQEACRALYLGMLQVLNDRNLVPLQASRTDGEYLQFIQQLPAPQPYQILLAIHEQLYFGNLAVSVDLFERCQRAYQEIKK